LRLLCGWQRAGEVPGESTFSRAFAALATSALPSRLHDALIEQTHVDRLVGPISRDSTAMEARAKPVKSAEPKPPPSGAQPPAQPRRKRDRRCKGEARLVEPPRRMERQLGMSLPAMLKDLPRHAMSAPSAMPSAEVRTPGSATSRIDTADREIPISACSRLPPCMTARSLFRSPP